MPEINNQKRSVELEEKIKVIDNEITSLFEKSNELGEQGKIEESEMLTLEIEKLVKKKEELEMYGDAPASDQQKHLKVCEICGALQTINDTDLRATTHYQGKLHTGFAKLRKELEKLQRRKTTLKHEKELE